jgi:hypothetical protein
MDLTHLYIVNDESAVIPVIEYKEGDEIIHTVDHPYCGEEGCPCGGGGSHMTDEQEEIIEEEQA